MLAALLLIAFFTTALLFVCLFPLRLCFSTYELMVLWCDGLMIRLGEEGFKKEHFRYPWHFYMEKEIWRSFLAQKRNISKSDEGVKGLSRFTVTW